ncbi:MAG: PLP-dependent aminotransferase family protein [Burkholderiaceae bacterium]
MNLLLTLDRSRPEPLHTQLFEGIRRLILTGQLGSGQRLPPTRDLAQTLRISRNTARLAYDRLAAEGYVEARHGSATYVAVQVPDATFRAAQGPTMRGDASDANVRVRRRAGFEAQLQDIFDDPDLAFDFALGRPDARAFPARVWQELIARTLADARLRAALTRYGDPAGFSPLREAIARHLALARGLQVNPAQVVIVSGSQEGLHLAYRLVCDPGRAVGIEDPCYQGALYLFRGLGAAVQGVAVDTAGICVDRLPASGFSLLYVTPSHQYPTGVTLSLDRRLALLEWAHRSDSLIVEDDYDSDFRYDGPPLTALAGLDPYQRVLYLGTFSKSIGPGLRLGYLVVPPWLAHRARTALGLMTGGRDLLGQAALAGFLVSGRFEIHLRRLRRVYNERRQRLIAELRRHFGSVHLTGAEAGLHLAWRLPTRWPTAEELRRIAAAAGVGLYSTRSGGAAELGEPSAHDRTVTLGFSSLAPEAIAVAINRLADALGETGGTNAGRRVRRAAAREHG